MNNLIGDIYNIKDIVQGMDHKMYIGINKDLIPDIAGYSFEANILSSDRKTILKPFAISKDIPNNCVYLTLSEVDTAGLPASQGGLKWELIVTDASGFKGRYISGSVTVAYRK